MALQVIGAGLGRTGTHSLAVALEKLGFGPCYHMLEVKKNPGHVQMWNDAIDGKGVDWDLLFSGYNSTVEWPSVSFLPQSVKHYPEAKVILTQRDPEAWYESASATIFEGLELSQYNPDPDDTGHGAMVRRLILAGMFSGRYWEKDHAIAVYKQHIRDVIELVPSYRLLQYRVADGWQKLCDFLGKPVPDEPFPRVNQCSSFLSEAPEWAKTIRRQRKKDPR